MGTEIERKFLVDRRRWQKAAAEADYDYADIEQAYLHAAKDLSVRVRIADDDASLTIKGTTDGFAREEYEYDIPLDDAKKLVDLGVGHKIVKRRYSLEADGKTWVVDEFADANAGLIVAEIELDSEDENFSRPAWLADEVSDDPAFFNSNLAEKPYSTWGAE